jgi:hypothetical protein
MRKGMSKKFNTQKGQALIEFALTFPLLLLMLAVVIEAGRLQLTRLAIFAGVQQGANYGGDSVVVTASHTFSLVAPLLAGNDIPIYADLAAPIREVSDCEVGS